MNLVKLKDDLYVPEDFAKNHNCYADPEGTKKYTGITSILGVLAKPALIQWASNENTKHIKANALRTGSAESFRLEEGKVRAEGVKLGEYIVSEELLEEARTPFIRVS